MLEFTPLTLDHFKTLKPWFCRNESRICDLTAGTVFMWRDMYKTQFCLFEDNLYFMVDYPRLGPTFTMPLGQSSRTTQLSHIAQYCQKRGTGLALYPVTQTDLDAVRTFFPESHAVVSRDTSDYLYRAEDLQFFRGKRFSGQRNHINRFQKTYDNWRFDEMTQADLPQVAAFLKAFASKQTKLSATYHEDLSKTFEVLDHFELYGMLGGILRVDGQIVAFSLGEIVGDTLFIHIEKADREYHGSYQMIVSQFAQRFASGETIFLNREDDAGDLGLRESKLSYHPVAILEKLTVTVTQPQVQAAFAAQQEKGARV